MQNHCQKHFEMNHIKIVFNFHINSDNWWKTRDRNVKFSVQINHKHTYKLHMKYCFKVNNYKHGDSANLRGYIWQI
jgi:hypothetical protein